MIVYYKHNQIDFERWDKVITNSQNGLVYALSWYLNIVSPYWDALIDDDYEYIMPLPVKYKFIIPYLVQPLFAQQLGIFSHMVITQEKVENFLMQIPRKFVRCNINLNSANPVNNLPSTLYGINYELSLNLSYKELWRNFNENTKRNIKKAQQNNLVINSCSVDYYIENFRENIKKTVPQSTFSILKNITQHLIDTKNGEIYIVTNNNNECVAGVFIINTLNRLIYLISFSSSEGKDKSAMFYILDTILQKYSGNNKVLDFEGSSIPGIARFFEGFGATKFTFPKIQRNIV